MTRPLRYDDSFKNILEEKIHDKFLGVFNVKVQSTAFCQRLNLYKALLISSSFDIFVGLVIAIHFFNNVHVDESFSYFLECFILIVGSCFGLVGLDSANNLRKNNMKVYKYWRIFVTFSIFILELISNFQMMCGIFKAKNCPNVSTLMLLMIYLGINLYLTKIAWSFYIRLARGHELLIIHGKYLETMMNEESCMMGDLKKYLPPEQLMSETRINIQNEMQTMSVTRKN